jgi:hypothetical protein
MSKRTFLNLLVVVFLLLPSLTAQAAPMTQGGNLLVNGDFETASGNSNTGLAVWSSWAIIDNCKPKDNSLNYSCWPNGFYKESPPGGAAFIHSGEGSVTIRNNWDPWTGGVKQVVSAPAGSKVRLTAYGHLWAAGKGYASNVGSDNAMAAISRIGLDPTGVDYPTAESQVIWSGTASPHDTWVPFAVEATVGASGRVQVILSTSYRGFSTNFMTASWDDAVLTVVAASTGAAAPAASAPSAPPTSPPVVKLPPFVMPTALSDGSVVYIVQSGDSLWRIAANTGKTIDEIKAMNGLTSNTLTAGQRLIIGQGPTATPAPTMVPTENVPAPTATALAPVGGNPQPTSPAAAAAGTTEICALLYEDINGNGVQDASEAAIASGQLAILDANTGAPLQAYTTKPEDANGYCFKNLPAGSYTVAATAPAGYNPTTATSILQKADTGLHYKLQFGAQAGSNMPAATGSQANLRTALFGAAGVVFLLLAAGVAGFLVLRRR